MKKEIRFNTGTVEIRADGDNSRIIEGYAFKYEKESKNLGGFNEMIMRGALDGANTDDVLALVNHSVNQMVGRTLSGTLELKPDDIGLGYRINTPETTVGNDLLIQVERKDIQGSSFAFTVQPNGESWEDRDNQLPLRKITAFRQIYDVSPVADPAYADTSVAKRSLDAHIEEIKENTKYSNRTFHAHMLNLQRVEL